MRSICVPWHGRAGTPGSPGACCRLWAVAEGRSRAAAEIGGMDRQILRDWVHRFNGGDPEGLLDRKTDGPPPKLSPAEKADLAVLVESRSRSQEGRRGALAQGRPESGERCLVKQIDPVHQLVKD